MVAAKKPKVWGPVGPVREALLETVQRLTLVAEFRDEDAHSHCRRVRYYTEFLVKRLGIPDYFVEQGTQEELYRECGFDAGGIEKTIRDLIQKK